MKRVAVVGPGGAGKSTFARALGAHTGLPVFHLDELHWKPGWVPTPREEWRALQEHLFAAERWIVDGHYSGTLDLRFERADTVIVLDLPCTRCVLRAFRRSVSNRGRAIQAPGCPEHVDYKFLRWIWRYPKDTKPRLEAALRDHAADTQVFNLRTPREVRAFLNGS